MLIFLKSVSNTAHHIEYLRFLKLIIITHIYMVVKDSFLKTKLLYKRNILWDIHDAVSQQVWNKQYYNKYIQTVMEGQTITK